MTIISFNVLLDKLFHDPLAAYAFDATGRLIDYNLIEANQVHLSISELAILNGQLFIGPYVYRDEFNPPTLAMMKQLNAYEPVLKSGLQGKLMDTIKIPAHLIENWQLCLYWVTGRVLKSPYDRGVCGARVHICEVDKKFFFKLTDDDIFLLRDDLLRVLSKKQVPQPLPKLEFEPLPRSPLRFNRLEHDKAADLNDDNALSVPEPYRSPEMHLALTSRSASVIRRILLANIDFIVPYLCLWPWWWWRLKYNEISVVDTDKVGRFETRVHYACGRDKPNLYFWVEYQLGHHWETVYRPPIACNTYWNYEDRSKEVILRIQDPRVPICDDEPVLAGVQVVVMSIGRQISISDIQGPDAAPADQGLTRKGVPFGGRLEPQVWFSRQNLLAQGISHYRWSYRRLTAPDGSTPMLGDWTIMTRPVGRHYAVIETNTQALSFRFKHLGPDNNNLFRIKPLTPPAPGIDWVILDMREDSASAFFETTKLPYLPDTPDACEIAKQTAGQYELKLELFRTDGTLVSDWEQAHIELKIADETAPFSSRTVRTQAASDYYRLKNSAGKTMGFRMVLRVDNNCCQAEINPLSGAGLSVDENCGILHYTQKSEAHISFIAQHPNHFATFSFRTWRGAGIKIAAASAAGKVGADHVNGFNLSDNAVYWNQVSIDNLLTYRTLPESTPCQQAVFAQRIHVKAQATDGWQRLSHLDKVDVAAFSLNTAGE